jgi:hypothetical protein
MLRKSMETQGVCVAEAVPEKAGLPVWDVEQLRRL